jgi:hypothetical protein
MLSPSEVDQMKARAVSSEQLPVMSTPTAAFWHFETISGDTIVVQLDRLTDTWHFARQYWNEETEDWDEDPISREQAKAAGWTPCTLYDNVS